jgi:hypothetical protein
MVLAIDDAFLPAALTARPMMDAQFAEFCSEHPDLCFEVTAEERTPAIASTSQRRLLARLSRIRY